MSRDDSFRTLLAMGHLGTAAKHLGNAEDRINDAIFYAMYNIPGFSMEAEQTIHKLSLVLRDVGRLEALIRDARAKP